MHNINQHFEQWTALDELMSRCEQLTSMKPSMCIMRACVRLMMNWFTHAIAWDLKNITIRLIVIQSNNVSCYRFSHLIMHLYVHDCFILVLYSGFTFHILLTHYYIFVCKMLFEHSPFSVLSGWPTMGWMFGGLLLEIRLYTPLPYYRACPLCEHFSRQTNWPA